MSIKFFHRSYLFSNFSLCRLTLFFLRIIVESQFTIDNDRHIAACAFKYPNCSIDIGFNAFDSLFLPLLIGERWAKWREKSFTKKTLFNLKWKTCMCVLGRLISTNRSTSYLGILLLRKLNSSKKLNFTMSQRLPSRHILPAGQLSQERKSDWLAKPAFSRLRPTCHGVWSKMYKNITQIFADDKYFQFIVFILFTKIFTVFCPVFDDFNVWYSIIFATRYCVCSDLYG